MKTLFLCATILALAGCSTTKPTAPTACTTAILMPRDAQTKQYKDLDRGVDAWTQCINDPRAEALKPYSLKMRAATYIDQKQPSKAIPDYEQALALVPAKTAWDVISLASAYRQAGEPEKALVLIQNMQADHLGMTGKGTVPGMPIYYHLGWTLSVLKRWPEAAEAFSEGLNYQPSYGWAVLRRGLAYEHQGNLAKAKIDTERARELLQGAYKGGSKSEQRMFLESFDEPDFTALLKRQGYDSTMAFLK